MPSRTETVRFSSTSIEVDSGFSTIDEILKLLPKLDSTLRWISDWQNGHI